MSSLVAMSFAAANPHRIDAHPADAQPAGAEPTLGRARGRTAAQAAAATFTDEERLLPTEPDHAGESVVAVVADDPAARVRAARSAAITSGDAAGASVPAGAAWTPITAHGGYGLALRRVEELLAARALLHDFPAEPPARLSSPHTSERRPGEWPVAGEPYAVLLTGVASLARIVGEQADLERVRTVAGGLDSFGMEAAAEIERLLAEAADRSGRRRGRLLFAGGATVAALLPVEVALDTGVWLAAAWERLVDAAGVNPDRVNFGGVNASGLSAGLALCPDGAPLERGLAEARAAWRRASALPGAVAISAGAADRPIRIVEPWPAGRLSRWLEVARSGMLDREVPRAWALLAAGWSAGIDASVLRAELLRVASRRGLAAHPSAGGEGAVRPEDVCWISSADDVAALVDVVLVARLMAGREHRVAPSAARGAT